MRSRAPVALLASLLAVAMVPSAANAGGSANLAPYSATVDSSDAAAMADRGIDMGESGYDSSKAGAQEVQVVLSPSQAAKLESDGIDVSPLPIDAPTRKSKALGDSPNPFFNVYRSYMEPGGIADEMRALAAANPDVMKLEQIGTSTLGKPILVIKMTADARSVPDGTRPAVLFSALNHAREWLAAEQGRRLPIWFAEHKNDPEIKELIRTREIWFMPIMNVDGYDFTFTCGLGTAQVSCDYRVRTADDNRFWRKTLRDNDTNGIYGNNQDGVDPNRNYPAKRGIDEEGASNSFSNETYRGPYALSEPENLAFDRLLRRVHFLGNVNYHTAGQLLLTPVSYTTDYAPPDATIFNAMTGTDGDSAVFPYTPQRSSDLYESNGDTIDNGYLNYGIIGWTPEMDTCATLGEPNGCNQFACPDDEGKVAAVFEKNLFFALNVVDSLPNARIARATSTTIRASSRSRRRRTSRSTASTSPTARRSRSRRSSARRSARPTSPSRASTSAATRRYPAWRPAPAGERYGEAPGQYFERAPRDDPGDVGTRTLRAGDIVNVVVHAGGLQQEFRYRVEATRQDATKKRVLVIAAEDYTGKSPNVNAGYDTAPRYLQQHVDALDGLGYEVVDVRRRQPAGQRRHAERRRPPADQVPDPPRRALALRRGRLRDGRRLRAAGHHQHGPKRMTSATAQTGSNEMARLVPPRDARAARLRQRRRQADRRRPQRPPGADVDEHRPHGHRPVHVDAGQAVRLLLPGQQRRRRRSARARRSCARATTSNDTWQNYLGVVGRAGGIGTTARPTPTLAGAPVAPGGRPVRRHGADHRRLDGGQRPEPERRRHRRAAGQDPGAPAQLGRSGNTNEPLRQERIEADYTTTPAQNATGGAIISTRDSVTFGFGLEQVDTTTRSELLKRSLSYLVPTTADTTAPTIVGYKYPAATPWRRRRTRSRST